MDKGVAQMSEFHFLRPHLLFLFIPFFIFLLFRVFQARHSDIWNKICSKDLLPYILVKKPNRYDLSHLSLAALGSLLIFALAGPSWQLLPQPLFKSPSGLVIALDLSPFMDAEDIKPSRLQRAIYKINDLLNLRQGEQTALIVFSEEAFVVTPLTDDAATIKNLLPALETKLMPAFGKQADKAISKAAALLHQAGHAHGSILLITAELTDQEMEQSIEIAKKKNAAISVLGVGTEERTPIPKAGGGFVKDKNGSLILSALSKKNLSQLASSTSGLFSAITLDDADINDLAAGFSGISSSHSEQTEVKVNQWHDQGYLLALLALPFALLLFRRGAFVFLLFLIPQTVQAGVWENLWKTPDQQAERFFQQEEYQQAKELFQNPDWKASANYRLAEFEAAADLFQLNQTADGFYNYGTSKAKQGQLEEALKAYEKALEIEPDHEDALYNKKIIEEHLRQDNQPQEQQDKENQDPNQDQESQNQEQNSGSGSQKEQESKQNQNQEKETDSQSDQEKHSNQQQEKPLNEKEPDEAEKQKMEDQYRNQVEEEMQKNESKESLEQIEQKNDPLKEDPQKQIDERWLQQVKDDPGGLLRRKFLQQYRQVQDGKR